MYHWIMIGQQVALCMSFLVTQTRITHQNSPKQHTRKSQQLCLALKKNGVQLLWPFMQITKETKLLDGFVNSSKRYLRQLAQKCSTHVSGWQNWICSRLIYLPKCSIPTVLLICSQKWPSISHLLIIKHRAAIFFGGSLEFPFQNLPDPSFLPPPKKKNIKNIFQMLNGMGIFVYQKNGWNERGGSGRRPQGKYSHPNWAHGASGNMIAIDFFEHFAPKTPLEQMEGVFLPKKWKVFITHENQGCGFPYHINILTCLSWPWKKSSILSLCI